MVYSLLGRLITGPLAFLFAGLYDFTAFLTVFAYRRGLARVRAWTTSRAGTTGSGAANEG